MVVYVVGHKNPDTDSVCSAIALAHLLNEWNKKENGLIELEEEAVPVVQGDINPETKYVLEKFDFEVPSVLSNGEGKKVFLVDHSDKSQSLNNIEKAEIVGIVDHHKVGDITTPNPILFVNLPVGSTATVIKLLYDWTGVEIPKNIAGILLASILSDTVIFKSATTTELDKKVAEELAEISSIENIEEFGIEIKSKLSEIENLPAKEIIQRDFKEFVMGNYKVGIGQVEVVDIRKVKNRIDELYEELFKIKEENNYHTAILMITDIIREGTELLVVTDDKSVIEKAFGVKLEGKSVWLDKVMSRKKQVVPPLQKAFSN